MYYDLNIPWNPKVADMQRTLAFLAELGYGVVAINYSITGKLPSDLKSPIPTPLPFAVPPNLTVLTRCTLTLHDTSQNHRLASLAANYSLLALQPTSEKALVHALSSPECDLVSLDCASSSRLPFTPRTKLLAPAARKGLAFEISYSPFVGSAGVGASAGAGSSAGTEDRRRNLIGNATTVVRAMRRGVGVVLASGAVRASAARAPADVVNLGVVWGLSRERAVEGVSETCRKVVRAAGMKRRAWRGVIDVVDGGIRTATIAPPAQDNISMTADSAQKGTSVDETQAEDRKLEAEQDNKEMSESTLPTVSTAGIDRGLTAKRKADTQDDDHEDEANKKTTTDIQGGNADKPVQLSKRQRRRQAHRARVEAAVAKATVEKN